RSAWGMNMAFRKSVFDVVGYLLESSGFHRPIAEDLEFSLRVKRATKKTIVFCRDAYVWHRVHRYRFSLRFILARSRHIGTSRYVLRKLDESDESRERRLLMAILRRFPKKVASNPRRAFSLTKLTFVVLVGIAIGYSEARVGLNDDVRMLVEERNVVYQKSVHSAICMAHTPAEHLGASTHVRVNLNCR
ncbi:MAG: hypothetical protein JRN67_00760, partial [Nitrososphaerota archaeon]|nr:hypothetical protein [Nitrososphaerota archaeon]